MTHRLHLMADPSHLRQRLPAIALRRKSFPRRSIWAVLPFLSLALPPANGANDLTLNVKGSTFVRLHDVITLTLDVAGLTVPINGIQAFVHYDPNVLRFVGTSANSGVGTGWTAVTEDLGGGDFVQLLIMLGGETSIDHAAATLTFQAIALGSTSVTFLPDDPPLHAKLTAAADASPMSPVTSGSEVIVVVPTDIPTVSQWGLATMALLLLTIGTSVLRRLQPARHT